MDGLKMKYDALIETFVYGVEADSEEEAQKKAAQILIEKLKDGSATFVVWENTDGEKP